MGPRAMHDELMENTRRLEHAALAPLSSEGLAAWLAEVDEAVADLERRWTARTVPPESTKRLISPGPRLAAVCARDPELRLLSDDIRLLRRQLRGGVSSAEVLDRAWSLRDRLVFASVEVRIADEALRAGHSAEPAAMSARATGPIHQRGADAADGSRVGGASAARPALG